MKETYREMKNRHEKERKNINWEFAFSDSILIPLVRSIVQIKDVESVLADFDKIGDNKDGNAYRMIILNEDDTHEERRNTDSYIDFFVSCDICNNYTRCL